MLKIYFRQTQHMSEHYLFIISDIDDERSEWDDATEQPEAPKAE